MAQTTRKGVDAYGLLHGWMFIHEHSPLEVPFFDVEGGTRELKQALYHEALFMVAFRLERNGSMMLRVPGGFRNQIVEYGKQIQLNEQESLRPLVAQCFYFFRDITHRHQHHSSRSDTLTTVWADDENGGWIRETLYELYRRVIMLRRQRSPRGQEDALGILAYIASFESTIAQPFREAVADGKQKGFVPCYDKSALKESLNSNLETKRRKRVQKNVVAAVVPAFTAAMLSLANSLYDYDIEAPAEFIGWLSSFSIRPISTSLAFIGSSEWTFPILAILGYVWISSFAGVSQLTEDKIVKGPAQAFASWGQRRAVFALLLIAFLMLSLSFALFKLSPADISGLFHFD